MALGRAPLLRRRIYGRSAGYVSFVIEADELPDEEVRLGVSGAPEDVLSSGGR